MVSVKDFLKKYWYFIVICFILTCGIFLRFEAFVINKVFTYDEAQLIYNITEHNGFLWAFKPLDCYQAAPALFLIATKILTIIFGIKEHVLRFIPFISCIASVFIFYNLTKKLFKTRHGIIFANFLFAANFILANSGSVFKQYGLDVSVFMLVLMFVSKIDVSNLKNSDILKYGLIFTLLCFTSQPVIFIIAGLVFYYFTETFKNITEDKNAVLYNFFRLCFIFLIPFVFMCLYKFSMPEDFNRHMNNYWQTGFISFTNIPAFIKENLEFLLYQSKYIILLIPFMFAGFFIFIFKKEKINRIFLGAIFSVFLASAFRIYPALGRVILYLVPFFIIFIAQCFDFNIPNKKISKLYSLSFIVFVVILMFLYQAQIICKNSRTIFFVQKEPCALNSILKENFKKEDCILVVPAMSDNIFNYYSKYLNFGIQKIVRINSFNKESFYKNLSKLQKNNIYWIYLVQDSVENPVSSMIEDWIKSKSNTGKCIYTKLSLGKLSHLYIVSF